MEYDSRKFLQSAFCPNIAISCSDEIDAFCGRFNLDFVQLLHPFTKLDIQVKMTDHSGATVTISDFMVKLHNLKEKPMSLANSRKLLSQAVSNNTESEMITVERLPYKFQIPKEFPWYEQWKEAFLKVQYPSDHEFLKHFLSCIFVISTTETNLFENLTNLISKTKSTINHSQFNKYQKWFDFNISYYYVLVHFDNNIVTDKTALKYVDALKTTYGAHNCYFLHLSNRGTELSGEELEKYYPREIFGKNDFFSIPVSEEATRGQCDDFEIKMNDNSTYHPLSTKLNEDVNNEKEDYVEGQEMVSNEILKYFLENQCDESTIPGLSLTDNDMKQLKSFMEHYVIKSFVPYIERKIFEISESISNLKTVSRSLLSVTKRWFQPQKSCVQVQQLDNQSLFANDSLELQYRRLADLYFMFRFYKLAFEAYHAVKKEFSLMQAWLCYAGALEMASISTFLDGSQSKKSHDYIDESIVTYLYTCKKPQFATRATIYSYERLRSSNLTLDCASQLIRMANDDSDLRSAILLEQAAYCFLKNSIQPHFLLVRKMGFNLIRAGHRFLKCNQKLHALRCYEISSEIYHLKDWHFTEDHINYTIANICYQLKQFNKAIVYFLRLLIRGYFIEFSYDQVTVLNHFFTCLKVEKDYSKPVSIPIPILRKPVIVLINENPEANSKILANDRNNSENISNWKKLEESIFYHLERKKSMFQSCIPYPTIKTENGVKIITGINETISIEVVLFNPLLVDFKLTNLVILYEFNDDHMKTFSNLIDDYDDIVNCTNCCNNVLLKGNMETNIVLQFKPLKSGNLIVNGIRYDLVIVKEDLQEIYCLNSKTDFGFDNRISEIGNILNFNVIEIQNNLEVKFSKIHEQMYFNEIQNVEVTLTNIGSKSLSKIYLISSNPDCLFSNFDDNKMVQIEELIVCDKFAKKDFDISDNCVINVIKNSPLHVGQSVSCSLCLKSNQLNDGFLYLVICYLNDKQSLIKHRVVKHFWKICSKPSISTKLVVHQNIYTKFTQEFHIYLTIKNCIVDKKMSIKKLVVQGNAWKLRDAVLVSNAVIDSFHVISILLHAILFIGTSESTITFVENNNISPIKFQTIKTHRKLKKNDAIISVNWFIEENNRKIHGITENVIQSFLECTKFEMGAIKNKSRPIRFDEEYEESDPDTVHELALNRQISYQMSFSSRFFFDFANSTSMCTVPIKIVFYNGCSSDVQLKIVFGGQHFDKNDYSNSKPLSNFNWLDYGVKFLEMKSKTSTTLNTRAFFSSPGIYDLSSRIQVLIFETTVNYYVNLDFLECSKNCTPILIFHKI